VKISRPLRLLVLLALLFQSPASSCFGQLFSGSSSERAARPVVVDFLDIGQGDSILVRSPEGKAALIDAGPTRDGAIRTLKSKGIRTIDIVIVTHHHSDHYGGMEQVVLSYKPKYFMATGSSHTTKGYLKLLQTVQEEGITAVGPTGKERKIELGSVLMTIFPQPPTNTDEENNNSIGLRLQYGTFSVLLTGDSETVERQWWIAHNVSLIRDCTILKLAHHGSHNGTDQRWLDFVQPELAVASLGKDNEYGHPHSETLSLLRSNDIPLLRTDQRGTITIISNGRTWNVVKPELARRKRSKSDADVASTSGDDKEPATTSAARTSTRRR
jgi:competence protein ComEC